jgi:hypothetical protein
VAFHVVAELRSAAGFFVQFGLQPWLVWGTVNGHSSFPKRLFPGSSEGSAHSDAQPLLRAKPDPDRRQFSHDRAHGHARYKYIGQDGIRGLYSQAGSFNDAAFVASGDNLWRVDKNGTTTFIGAIGAPSPNNAVIMAATSNIGVTPAYLFVCGGGPLMLYMENGYARGTIGGTPANNDVVQIGGVYYKFTNGGVNVGAPAGTNANPWLVALGVCCARVDKFRECGRQ